MKQTKNTTQSFLSLMHRWGKHGCEVQTDDDDQTIHFGLSNPLLALYGIYSAFSDMIFLVVPHVCCTLNNLNHLDVQVVLHCCPAGRW